MAVGEKPSFSRLVPGCGLVLSRRRSSSVGAPKKWTLEPISTQSPGAVCSPPSEIWHCLFHRSGVQWCLRGSTWSWSADPVPTWDEPHRCGFISKPYQRCCCWAVRRCTWMVLNAGGGGELQKRGLLSPSEGAWSERR